MLSVINSFQSRISVNQSLKILLFLTLCISAFKNLFFWKLYLAHDPSLYHYPIFRFLAHQSVFLDWFILIVSILSIVFFYTKFSYVPLFVNGMANLYFQFSDYFALHHDMILSGLVFNIFGLHHLSNSKLSVQMTNNVLLAVISTSYFLSGIAKVDAGFLSGAVTSAIISRAEVFPWWNLFFYLSGFAIALSIFAMLVEVIEPLVLLFTRGGIKVFSVMVTFPFHLGILLTGTGTVYNLIYPLSFMHLVLFYESAYLDKAEYCRLIYYSMIFILSAFALCYLALMLVVVLTGNGDKIGT